MVVKIKEHKGLKVWYYDFKVNSKRHRGWLDPVDHMTKRQAVAEVRPPHRILCQTFQPVKQCDRVAS